MKRLKSSFFYIEMFARRKIVSFRAHYSTMYIMIENLSQK